MRTFFFWSAGTHSRSSVAIGKSVSAIMTVLHCNISLPNSKSNLQILWLIVSLLFFGQSLCCLLQGDSEEFFDTFLDDLPVCSTLLHRDGECQHTRCSCQQNTQLVQLQHSFSMWTMVKEQDKLTVEWEQSWLLIKNWLEWDYQFANVCCMCLNLGDWAWLL